MAKTLGWVTCQKLPEGCPREEDCRRFVRETHDVVPWVWDQPAPAPFDRVVVRSPWDYHLHPERWLQWLDELPCPSLNPVSVLRWNSHKGYLLELEAAGVPIVPTRLVRAGEEYAVEGDQVVKPAISASAHNTERVRGFHQGMAATDLLIQPFLPEVKRDGEWSLVFLDREFSHAVVKRPGAGDFRSQEEHGGLIEPATPPPALVRQAQAMLEHVREPLLYCRVDGVVRDGTLLLMELELIDAALFFEHHPPASRRLAELLCQELA